MNVELLPVESPVKQKDVKDSEFHIAKPNRIDLMNREVYKPEGWKCRTRSTDFLNHKSKGDGC